MKIGEIFEIKLPRYSKVLSRTRTFSIFQTQNYVHRDEIDFRKSIIINKLAFENESILLADDDDDDDNDNDNDDYLSNKRIETDINIFWSGGVSAGIRVL